MLLTLPQEPLERALQSAGERKSKEDRDQRERTCRSTHQCVPLRPLLSQSPPPLSPPRDPPPRRAPTFSCASQPRSFPSSPVPRFPSRLTRAPEPGLSQTPRTPRLPTGSPRTRLTPHLPSPAGKQLTAPCYSPPSLRLSEEAPNRALRLAHMAYAEYRHPNNHRRKSRHSSLP